MSKTTRQDWITFIGDEASAIRREDRILDAVGADLERLQAPASVVDAIEGREVADDDPYWEWLCEQAGVGDMSPEMRAQVLAQALNDEPIKGAGITRPSERTLAATRLYNRAVELVAHARIYSEESCSAAAAWLSEDAEVARADGDEEDAQALWAIAEVLLRNVNDLDDRWVLLDTQLEGNDFGARTQVLYVHANKVVVIGPGSYGTYVVRLVDRAAVTVDSYDCGILFEGGFERLTDDHLRKHEARICEHLEVPSLPPCRPHRTWTWGGGFAP